MKTVYLKTDTEERYSSKTNRSWFRVSYRLVDVHGNDLVQPWFKTKGEATSYANSRGWKIQYF